MRSKSKRKSINSKPTNDASATSIIKVAHSPKNKRKNKNKSKDSNQPRIDELFKALTPSTSPSKVPNIQPLSTSPKSKSDETKIDSQHVANPDIAHSIALAPSPTKSKYFSITESKKTYSPVKEVSDQKATSKLKPKVTYVSKHKQAQIKNDHDNTVSNFFKPQVSTNTFYNQNPSSTNSKKVENKGVSIPVPGSKKWKPRLNDAPYTKSKESVKYAKSFVNVPQVIGKVPAKIFIRQPIIKPEIPPVSSPLKSIQSKNQKKRKAQKVLDDEPIDLTLTDSDDDTQVKQVSDLKITRDMMDFDMFRLDVAPQVMSDALIRIFDFKDDTPSPPKRARHSLRLKKTKDNKHVVLHLISNIKITIGILVQAIIPGYWFCDVIINTYFGLLEFATDDSLTLSSFFMTVLVKKRVYCYENIRKWTKKHKQGLYSFKKVVIPINVNKNHWILATIDVVEKRVEILDSLPFSKSTANTCLRYIKRYLRDEHMDKIGTEMDIAEWTFEANGKSAKQQDGSSCGVFTCLNAKKFLFGESLKFGQRDVDVFRTKIMCDLAMAYK